ncbi:RNA polymerase sigma-70 factor [Pedobacter alluvionis]|uniref:RNA polymerase sigma-70 factor n=1 Tax=Pedobacter alluvionis TaxID=475253 RepID=A0A497XNJ7_9SPHI|nr:RNA polymerase sigma-70 factor [Pedobacter alluvionis]RLJ69564.1 RNA polymerase sigma-70 factor (ECF subfamily) [Pedobacter alluvionis]TFB28373.1 RNA polymerase sigma-70 factor [Pedobacter alluvionis]
MKQHMENLTNQQMLGLVRSGDDSAFHEFYRRNRNKVMGFAYRFLKDQEEAKELTQEIFVNLWENKEKIDPDKQPEALLFIMVRSRFLDSLKRKASQSRYVERELQVEPCTSSTDHYINFKDCGEIASLAIENLPKQAKIIYLLSRNNGWSHKEISDHMHISKKTVNNQITKSIGHIRGYFKHLSPETVLMAFLLFRSLLPEYL